MLLLLLELWISLEVEFDAIVHFDDSKKKDKFE